MTIISVGMADLNVCKNPDVLTTLALGSCVGIALYDPLTRVSGLAHIMLPDSTRILKNSNKAKFADTAIELMVEKMIELGASRRRLVAKLAGGAQMFMAGNNTGLMKIGEQNEIASREKLEQLGIKIISSDCGKNYGRTVVFYSETGMLEVKSIGRSISLI
jgi:chemotaxis protein CheD